MDRVIRSAGAATLGLALLAATASPMLAQEDCRGWARSCAAVDVRVEGDRLVLFTPNTAPELDADGEPIEDAERLTIVPAEVGDEPFVTAGAGGTGAFADDGRSRTRKCDREDPELATTSQDDDERDRGCAPVGALLFLALPATLYAFGPGDEVGPITIEGPDNAPVAGPADPGGSEDGGASTGGGATTADDTGNDGSNGDGSGDGDSGTSGATTGENGGNNESGTTGGTGGDSGTGGSGDTGGNGPGDDWGPFHPKGTPPATLPEEGLPGAADLPPISQVPEPISTTLFGLGLAGYAGVQARRRRQGIESEEG